MDDQTVLQLSSACALCGQNHKHLLFEAVDYISREKFALLRCETCGLIETAPRPSGEALGHYYPDAYFGSEEQRFIGLGQRLFRQGRLQLAERIHAQHKQPGRALDIGCGPGWMLQRLHQHGWDCYGTEWSQELANRLNEMGLHVYRELDVRNCSFAEQSFDVVTLWHVFEHISNPSETLDEIHRILKPGGLLIIATPDIGGAVAQFTRDNWFALDVPRHLYHYSYRTLPEIMTRHGFKVIRRHDLSMEQDVFGMAQSLMNKAGFRFNRFYMAIRHQSAQAAGAQRETIIQKISFIAAALATTALSVPGAPLLSVVKRGGTIEVWAQR
jgi:2-polyprenyl-3-methyl-5-hydroxy-6-metoxy-1,4-benzoquinol methylase